MKQYINGYEQRKFADTLQQLQAMYDEVGQKNFELYNELEGFNKDAEIQEWQAKCAHARSHSLHNLSDNELKLYTLFKAQHYKSCHNGDTFVITLSGSWLGEEITVACPICGIQQNITDVSNR